MSRIRGIVVGLCLLTGGCGPHPTASDWVDVDLMGTDQLWSMFPDSCWAVDANTVQLGEDGYAGAQLAIQADPYAGTRVGITIPDEPISLWIGEGDGCQYFAVELLPGEFGVAASVELECELGWVSVWASAQFTDC